jgi:hypothetical protein
MFAYASRCDCKRTSIAVVSTILRYVPRVAGIRTNRSRTRNWQLATGSATG